MALQPRRQFLILPFPGGPLQGRRGFLWQLSLTQPKDRGRFYTSKARGFTNNLVWIFGTENPRLAGGGGGIIRASWVLTPLPAVHLKEVDVYSEAGKSESQDFSEVPSSGAP